MAKAKSMTRLQLNLIFIASDSCLPTALHRSLSNLVKQSTVEMSSSSAVVQLCQGRVARMPWGLEVVAGQWQFGSNNGEWSRK